MKQFIIAFSVFAIFLTTETSLAKTTARSTWQDLIQSNAILKTFLGQPECPENPPFLSDMDAEKLWQRGLNMKEKGRLCDAAQSYAEIMRQHPQKKWWKKSWIALIETYVQARDPYLTVNEANVFIDQMQGTPEAEYVHFLMLTSIFERSQTIGPDRSQEWTKYALGIHSTQTADAPYLLRLSFVEFLKEYPEGPYSKQIENELAEIKNTFAEHWLNIGKYYVKKKEYPAAIERFRFILEWGPGIESFDETLYCTIDALYRLSIAILDKRQISDRRLGSITAMPIKQINRQQLAQETRNEALRLKEMFLKERPKSPWRDAVTQYR